MNRWLKDQGDLGEEVLPLKIGNATVSSPMFTVPREVYFLALVYSESSISCSV